MSRRVGKHDCSAFDFGLAKFNLDIFLEKKRVGSHNEECRVVWRGCTQARSKRSRMVQCRGAKVTVAGKYHTNANFRYRQFKRSTSYVRPADQRGAKIKNFAQVARCHWVTSPTPRLERGTSRCSASTGGRNTAEPHAPCSPQRGRDAQTRLVCTCTHMHTHAHHITSHHATPCDCAI